MQKYRCHKEVWALKIKEVRLFQMPVFAGATCKGCFALNSACGRCERCEWERSNPRAALGGATILSTEQRDAPILVGQDYLLKHKPEAGGYYVYYADGYESFSPAKAFEDGYEAVAE